MLLTEGPVNICASFRSCRVGGARQMPFAKLETLATIDVIRRSRKLKWC